MNLILCIETSTDTCSVVLARDGRPVSEAGSGGRDHSRLLGVCVDSALRQAGVSASDLSAVAVSSGPGSYTGLRIGVSMAKGICYGTGVPLIGVGSLESLARVAVEERMAGGFGDIPDFESCTLCPMIDARRMEVYAQVFDASLNPLSDVQAEVVDGNSFAAFRSRGRMLIFGDGAAKCAEALEAGSPGGNVSVIGVTPSARGLIAPAVAALREGRFEDTAYFEPFYLKDFLIKPGKKNFF